MFVNNLVSSLKFRPVSDAKYRYVQDIKYQNGEADRALKIVTYKNSLIFDSKSPNMVSDDIEALRMHRDFFKQLHEKKPEKTDKKEIDNDG